MKVNNKSNKKYEYVAFRFPDNITLCKKCHEDSLPLTKEDLWEDEGESIPCSNCGTTIEAVPPKKKDDAEG